MKSRYQRLHPNKRGSNGYKLKKRWSWIYWLIIYIVMLISLWLVVSIGKKQGAEAAYKEMPIISGYVDVPYPTATPIKSQPESEYDTISDEIKTVFGKDFDKAMKLLSCENAKLNPKAVNTAGNVPAGSRDIGIFQINEYHQGVHSKFLLDYKVNIHLAKKIFDDSGKTFKMWTCGKKFNI